MDRRTEIGSAVETIILRRLHKQRIDGYTLEMSREIADAVLALPLSLGEEEQGLSPSQTIPSAAPNSRPDSQRTERPCLTDEDRALLGRIADRMWSASTETEKEYLAAIIAEARAEGRQSALKRSYEQMVEGGDGWSDWIHPLPGYLMKCCDCGLVHDMQFEIALRNETDVALNPGESDDGVIIMRARRHPEGEP